MNWTEENNKLQRKFKFESFMQAMEFMQRASREIDAMDHHPEWSNVYNTVDVTLCTHDAGNTVTDKDRKLADVLDKIYGELKPL